MTGFGRSMAAGLFVLAAVGTAQAADRMQATLDRPAVLTAHLTGPMMTDTPGPLRLYLSVVAFTPPHDRKPVEIVVSASLAANGPARELGRAAITPSVAFGAKNRARRQELAFPVPGEFKFPLSLTVTVALHPVNGGGTGASLQIGDASIR